ncbi:MAG: branched-chain amino acid ABC transporter permease [Pigmentiphaga sp.]
MSAVKMSGSRIRVAEFLFWLLAVAVMWGFPQHAALWTEIVILALFALSLDLILGYGGIVSLGHAAFFGFGAYAAGLFAIHVSPDPLLGLAAATAGAALLGLLSSVIVLRGSDLTRLMVTLAVGLILFEIANRFSGLTGGADGLPGIFIDPVFGVFEFDLPGVTGGWYSLAVLFLLFVVARRLTRSPFGVGLEAIRDNRLRATAIGIPVNRRLAAIYTIGAAFAGAAGALLTQTTGFASLDVLSFERSADVLLALVLGGTGYLYGGLIGAAIFVLMHDLLSTWTPHYWLFWMGFALVAIVLIGRERLYGGVAGVIARLAPKWGGRA